MAKISQYIGLQYVTVSTFVKLKKCNLLSHGTPDSVQPPALDKDSANAYDYPDINLTGIVAEAHGSTRCVFQSVQPQLGGDDGLTAINIDTATGGLIPVVYGVNVGVYLPDDYGDSQTAQNSGMSIETILARFAAGDSLPVSPRGMRSDEDIVSSPDELLNATTSKQSVFDGIDAVRDAKSRKAAYDADKASKTSQGAPESAPSE